MHIHFKHKATQVQITGSRVVSLSVKEASLFPCISLQFQWETSQPIRRVHFQWLVLNSHTIFTSELQLSRQDTSHVTLSNTQLNAHQGFWMTSGYLSKQSQSRMGCYKAPGYIYSYIDHFYTVGLSVINHKVRIIICCPGLQLCSESIKSSLS